jgi:gliding motility-associated-like protein
MPDINSNFRILGNTSNYPDIFNTQSDFIASFTASGKLIDRVKIRVGEASSSTSSIVAKNGDMIVLGSVIENNTRYVTITRLTPDLTVLWNIAYPFASVSMFSTTNLLEDDDGNIYFGFGFPGTICKTEEKIVKLNADGSLAWMRGFSSYDACFTGLRSSVAQDDQFLYFAIEASNGAGLIKVAKSTGNLIWSRQFKTSANTAVDFSRIAIVGNKLVIQGNMYSNQFLLLADKEGQFIKSVTLHNLLPAMTVTKNSDIVLVTSMDNDYKAFVRLDSNLNFIYSKKTASRMFSLNHSIIETPDGGILGVGNNVYTETFNHDFTAFKFREDGTTEECPSDTLVIPQQTIQFTLQTLNGEYTSRNMVPSSFPVSFLPFALQENSNYCITPATCVDFDFSGPNKICELGPITIEAIRNANCTNMLHFSLEDNANADIVSFTSNTATLLFKKAGRVKLIGRMFDGCNWVEHSFEIDANPQNEPLNLGADTSICSGTSLEIKAASGFTSYTWNTGSTDEKITVTQPGPYYLDVVDACNNIKSDTIYITELHAPSFSLGGDRNICSGDTIHLNAPSGFTNFVWRENNQVLPATPGTLIVRPIQPTTYILNAKAQNSCVASDTLLIGVLNRAPLNLPPVQPFCEADSIKMSAPGGFISYFWSTQQSGASIYIKQSGAYYLEAVAANGCISRDTLIVPSLYALPTLMLPRVAGICETETLQLDAGLHVSQVWQDGSTDRIFSVSAPGTYHVTVSNSWGCTSSDTMTITQLFRKPVGFLSPDTVICRTSTIRLSAKQNFASYNWSTGASSSSITIAQPGTYWLEVSDQNGCAEREYIQVRDTLCHKEGIYFPSAFTPNGDGKNDRFKPIVVGNLLKYEFSIYNRFGQRVFSTRHPDDGWDGTVKRAMQDSHNFVWTCTYQFEGGVIMQDKGNLLLLR